jgi:hypothetical protein
MYCLPQGEEKNKSARREVVVTAALADAGGLEGRDNPNKRKSGVFFALFNFATIV